MKKGKKVSGGKYIKSRKKKSYEIAGQRRNIKLGEEKRKLKRTKGGNKKAVLFSTKFVNLGKGKKTEIENVLETPSNKFLARQNIITKGTIVKTKLGKVKITNRPTQEGFANGVLVEN